MHQDYQIMISSLTSVFDLFGHVKPQENATYSARLTGRRYVKQQQRRLTRWRSSSRLGRMFMICGRPSTSSHRLFDAIDKHIPSVLRSGKHQLPRMKGKLRHLTKKRRLYKQARKTGSWKYRYTQKSSARQNGTSLTTLSKKGSPRTIINRSGGTSSRNAKITSALPHWNPMEHPTVTVNRKLTS